MNETNKAKVMAVIKTLLISQPNRIWTSRNLSEYINMHNYHIGSDITPSEVAQLIRVESKRGDGWFRVDRVRVKGNTYMYKARG